MRNIEEKYCSVCEKSHKTTNEGEMICELKGVVSPDYKCRKFIYDPLKHIKIRKISEIKNTPKSEENGER